MPTNKDQKRLIRARMKKTGEAYTAARAHVVARKHDRDDEGPKPPKAAAPRAQWAVLAGTSDEAVADKTGRDWAGWVADLDAVEAWRMSHRDIARHLGGLDGVSAWWAQTVAVGYERIRGLRDVGQRRGGSYDANKSRTFAVDVGTLYRMVKDARRRRRWLPEGLTRIRTSIESKSIRADWHDGTKVAFFFVAKGRAKAMVSVQHGKLADRDAVAAAKAFWHERLDALAAGLA